MTSRRMRPDGPVACGFYETPWGAGLVAASERLVEHIWLPDERQELLSRFEAAFGPASCATAPPVLAAAVGQLERYFAGEPIIFDLPLNTARLTPFQQRVAAAARAIPRGTVRTYGWLAARAGSPAAFRACGQVMAANCFPVVVPCHRVVASGGRLGGFSAGLVWKERLLALEGVTPGGAV